MSGFTLRTPLCELFGIEYPIFPVGFGQSSGPDLVAAVSGAGAFGVLGASGMEPDEIRRRIARARELTGKPMGVNIIIDEETDEDRAFLLDMGARGCRRPHRCDRSLLGRRRAVRPTGTRGRRQGHHSAGSVQEAEDAAAAGVDAIIAQGFEAGGHVKGTTPLWELLPEVVDAVKPVPVLASGAIGDGAGIARSIEMGAQGVSLGTRFVASREAWIHPAYKQRVTESSAEDTFYGNLYDVWWPNAPHRTLRNKTFDEWDAAGRPPPGERPGEGTSIGMLRMSTGDVIAWPRYAIGMAAPDFEGDIEYAPMWAGLSVSQVNDVKPAAEIVSDLVREAEAALR